VNEERNKTRSSYKDSLPLSPTSSPINLVLFMEYSGNINLQTNNKTQFRSQVSTAILNLGSESYAEGIRELSRF
jgi:hypothetical protein